MSAMTQAWLMTGTAPASGQVGARARYEPFSWPGDLDIVPSVPAEQAARGPPPANETAWLERVTVGITGTTRAATGRGWKLTAIDDTQHASLALGAFAGQGPAMTQ